MIKYFMWHIEASLESILLNKFRSLLTMLGVIFGVASVICMMAIGKGTEKEILDQIESIGAKTIIVQSNFNENSEKGEVSVGTKSNYLHSSQINSIQKVVSSIKYASPFVESKQELVYQNKLLQVNVIGISNDYFAILNHQIYGRLFHPLDQTPVCIISQNLTQKIFIDKNPIGQKIRVANVVFQIVGVSNKSNSLKDENMSFSNDDAVVYIPFQTFKSRIPTNLTEEEKTNKNQKENPNLDRGRLDKIIVQVNSIDELESSEKLLQQVLSSKISKDAFKVIVPLEILKQHQKSKRVFGIVLGLIAGISLLVGGIGIMNIMMASVYERIKEIGIRMAVGASKLDIQNQFLMESSLICIIGGIIGVFIGVFSSIGISYFTGIRIAITLTSIFLAFIISITVGIISGIIPAQKAANQNPVESIHYE